MAESRSREDELVRMAAMLSRLSGRGYQVEETLAVYGVDLDPDSDSDFDLDRNDEEPRSCVPGDA